MTMDLSGRLVFLASPGDLANERAVCRKALVNFNEERANPNGVHFIVKGWEQVPGGVGRAQASINEHLDQCDFMILMLGDHWGTPPSLDGRFTSGTEEEFHRCRQLLVSADANMRDILVLFKTVEPSRLRDPGEQLTKVIRFRSGLEKSKNVFYGTFDSDESLTNALARKLAEWAEPLSAKVPVEVEMWDEAESSTTPSDVTAAESLETAKKHADAGRTMHAEACFANAIKGDDPEALTEFAQFMRRTGRLDQALALNRQLLANPVLLGRTDAEAVAYRTNSLANMGVIYRKSGALTQSRDSLREAVSTARSSNEPIDETLCYALDNYGLTLLKINQVSTAIACFEESHGLRKELGSSTGIAQSAINLGRAQMRVGNYASAERLFDESLQQLGQQSDEHLTANALAGLAESKLRQNATSSVQELVARSLAINEKIQNSDGISIANALYARLLLLDGSLGSASEHANASLSESRKSNNSNGQGTATWLLSEISLRLGELTKAERWLQSSTGFAAKAQSELLDRDIEATRQKLLNASQEELWAFDHGAD